MPDAITSVFPDTVVQTCVVHVIRNAMRFVSYQDRKKIATSMRTIYTAPTVEAAESELMVFADPVGPPVPGVPTCGERLERVHPVPGLPAGAAPHHLHHG